MIPETTLDDTIPVRMDEQFDEEKVAEFCRGRVPGSDNPLKVRQFGGGKANLTYLLDYGTHQYVLRRPCHHRYHLPHGGEAVILGLAAHVADVNLGDDDGEPVQP